MPESRPAVRTGRAPLAAALLVAMVAGGLGGCKSVGLGDITGSIGRSAPSSDPATLRGQAEELGRQYERRPEDPRTAMAYARVLRAQEQHSQAVAVLQTASTRNPQNLELLAAYGKALADAGRFKEAQEVLARAHTPDRPNWSVLSAQGSVADQLGDQKLAQQYYDAALKIAPGEPGVMSNLGLSYALGRDLPRAEATLREASAHARADMRVRQNLALVLALQGKFTEAEDISRRDLSPADAAANVSAIRKMIAESNTWRQIQQGGKPPPRQARRG
ncbi:MAG: tetratricopeptide repeat protein [Methylobacteriaceae bacterium]|nr:tetratricopeptide repeat protein [Methylobacteriaceae bacterium]